MIYYPECTPEQMWYVKAIEQCPTGILCSKCGKLNDLWDDIGWFYEDKPVCKSCSKAYGRGER